MARQEWLSEYSLIRDGGNRQPASGDVEAMSQDSFPASDPPSSSGTIAGSPPSSYPEEEALPKQSGTPYLTFILVLIGFMAAFALLGRGVSSREASRNRS